MAAMELLYIFIVSLNHHEVSILSSVGRPFKTSQRCLKVQDHLLNCSKQLNVIRITCLIKYGVIKYMIGARDLTKFYNIFSFSASRQH